QNVVHSDSDLILHNSSVLIDKEPKNKLFLQTICENSLFFYFAIIFLLIGRKNSLKLKKI
ncbi:hypothetical protein SJ953_13325, partial [Enterococcus faecium]